MRTHERTLQTLKLAALYVLVAAALYFALGCGKVTPTGPSTELEGVFLDLAQCYADELGLGTVTLGVFEKARPYCPREGPCGYVACGAWPDSRTIECWGDWINNPSSVVDFPNYAAHEVCHLSGIWDEMEAELCAFALTSKGVCP